MVMRVHLLSKACQHAHVQHLSACKGEWAQFAEESAGVPVQPQQAVPKQAASVAADDSQPECALSGELFETFWDDAAEEWRFRDAVRLSARQAARCAPTCLPLPRLQNCKRVPGPAACRASPS